MRDLNDPKSSVVVVEEMTPEEWKDSRNAGKIPHLLGWFYVAGSQIWRIENRINAWTMFIRVIFGIVVLCALITAWSVFTSPRPTLIITFPDGTSLCVVNRMDPKTGNVFSEYQNRKEQFFCERFRQSRGIRSSSADAGLSANDLNTLNDVANDSTPEDATVEEQQSAPSDTVSAQNNSGEDAVVADPNAVIQEVAPLTPEAEKGDAQ